MSALPPKADIPQRDRHVGGASSSRSSAVQPPHGRSGAIISSERASSGGGDFDEIAASHYSPKAQEHADAD
jgi:hypothetical protein